MNRTKSRQKASGDKGFSVKIFRPETAFIIFCLFITCVFMMGGSARNDVFSLVFLRPIAAIGIAYALIYKFETKQIWPLFPLMMIGLLALWIAVQLIPLPPEIWMQLPQRDIYAQIAILADIEQPWRPISLSPSKGWNSLFSLLVPIAAMMLFFNLDKNQRKNAMLAIIILIALSAFWGILQTLGSPRSPLYLYNITNNGSSVGLMANRNHQAFLLAALILLLGHYYKQEADRLNPLKISLALGGIFILVPLIFITGSRAGLILMIPALIVALYFIYIAHSKNMGKSMGKSRDKSRRKNSAINKKGASFKLSNIIKNNSQNIMLIAMMTAIITLAASSIFFSRSLAFDRLFSDGGIEELRINVTPTLLRMAQEYMPFGAGYGSFEHIYKIYEPVNLLNPAYFNQAHNDWLQWVIEGGIPALLLLAIFIFWIVKNVYFLIRHWKILGYKLYDVIMCLIFLALLSLASIGDYPVRVPSIMALTAIIISYLSLQMAQLHKEIKII